MRTRICEMFGVDVPIFAFSHCRDVVVEVSRAGGIGVFGITYFTPEQLDMELKWIDEHVGGRPYGVDILIPTKQEKVQTTGAPINIEEIIPKQHRDFVEKLLEKHHVRPLPPGAHRTPLADVQMGGEQANKLLEVAFSHPIALYANALGVAPKELIAQAHKKGIKVSGLVGKVEHAYRHRDAGVDFIIAQGTEAGGHTGDVSTLVLTPQVIEAVAPIPVVAAGGIASGRQLAAALMLGAEGVWCGSVWLTTKESDLVPEIKARLLQAKSTDAVRGKWISGKPQRHLRGAWSEAWDSREAPQPLPFPLQNILMSVAQVRIMRDKAAELMYCPVGQVVGTMDQERSVRQVIQEMLTEVADATERYARIIGAEGTAQAEPAPGRMPAR